MTRMKRKPEERDGWSRSVPSRQVGRNVTKIFILIKLGFEMLNIALVIVHKTESDEIS